jgi:16S rRNA A1518/A1519 N6-dimethyltransferase RsmA/KsgA/DIM1 with predicted DNA glycosylase/AP lyase activity
MLRSSLKSLTPAVSELLTCASVPGESRAEELDIAQFCALARAYRQLR